MTKQTLGTRSVTWRVLTSKQYRFTVHWNLGTESDDRPRYSRIFLGPSSGPCIIYNLFVDKGREGVPFIVQVGDPFGEWR